MGARADRPWEASARTQEASSRSRHSASVAPGAILRRRPDQHRHRPSLNLCFTPLNTARILQTERQRPIMSIAHALTIIAWHLIIMPHATICHYAHNQRQSHRLRRASPLLPHALHASHGAARLSSKRQARSGCPLPIGAITRRHRANRTTASANKLYAQSAK